MVAQAVRPIHLSPLVKACAQFHDYHIAPRSLTGNDWTVINKTGAEYVVDADRQTCTCPAFASRHRRNETNCKHVEAVKLHRAGGYAPALPDECLPLSPADDPFAPEPVGDDDDPFRRPTLDEELRLGFQDEERSNRRTLSAAARAALLSLWD